jgi:hypothetical protein
MSLYVTFPHLSVQRANAFAGAGILSLTPVMAASMMAEAFGHHYELKINGVMLIHHDAYLMAEQDLEWNSHKYHLQKLQGATLFNQMDVNSKHRTGADASPVNSDQPNAFMSGQWSLVLEVDDSDDLSAEELENDASQFLNNGARLAGGVIQTYGKPCAGNKLYGFEGRPQDKGVINRSIGNGFITLDRSEQLQTGEGSRVDRFLSIMALDSMDEGETKGWFSPAVLGYALISDLEEKEQVRENKLHAFCESVIGMTQLVSLRDLVAEDENQLQGCFWSHGWTKQETFLLSQPQRN